MKPAKVSFVVVAKNEAQVLGRCLSSIERLECSDCEVICVDSDSNDGTFAIMNAFASRLEGWRALRVPGCRNSAEARNVGMAAASCPWIFLIDGDIELYSDFLTAALKELRSGAADAVTGGLDEILYSDDSFEPISERYCRIRYPETQRLMACGGTFVATREIVQAVGDFDVRFDRSQDLDFTLRLSSRGTLLGIPEKIGLHHTREFRTRAWDHVRNGSVLCQGMLARKHHGRSGFARYWLASRKSYVAGLLLTLGLTVTAAMTVLGLLTPWALGGVIVAALVVEWTYSRYRRQPIAGSLVLHLVSPVLIVVGYILEPHLRAPDRPICEGADNSEI